MKDEDIILACELCLNAGESCPYNCPYYEYSGLSCQDALSEDAFDLINRQQAMIDDLAEDIEYWMQRASNDKEKAIKDFAEKLNKEITQALESNYKVRSKRREKPDYMTDPLIDVINGKIDALSGMQHCIVRVLKEMTEIRGV